jgi:O-antigen/teichoic acid export membrane protein
MSGDVPVRTAMTPIYSHMLRGSVWAILMRWCIRIIGLVSTVILARVLAPTDFGLVAMGTLMIGLLTTFSELGEGQLLMREPNVTRAHCDTAWTIRLLKSIGIALILALGAPLAVRYFREPRAAQVFYVLALAMAISGLQNIGMVLVNKNLDFARDFRFNVYSKLVRFSTTVPLAFLLRSYWALLVGYLVNSVVDVLMTYRMHPYRPKLSLEKVRAYLRFSVAMVPLNVGGFLSRKVDTFIVGRIGEASLLGSYNVASELSAMATEELGAQVSRALFPSYAKLIDRPAELAEAFIHSMTSMACVSLALGFGLAAVADDFVRVVLGSQWAAAIPFLQWLAICGALRSVTQLMGGSILVVTGHERTSATLTWLRLAFAAPAALAAGHWWGVTTIPIAMTAANFVILPFAAIAVRRAIAVTYAQIVGALWRPALATTAMVLAARWPLLQSGNALPDLALRVAIGAAVFGVVLAGSWLLSGRPAGPERALVKIVMQRIRR